MEFTIDRSLFLEGLEKTLSVVEKRNTMPSLNHALIDIKEDQLQISATDLEIFVSASVPCKVTTSGRIALPAKNLYDIVKELQANEVKIRGLENNRVEIKSGKSLFFQKLKKPFAIVVGGAVAVSVSNGLVGNGL